MIIKVCGLREPDNIRAIMQLNVDWIGLNFIASDPRYVSQIQSRAGIIPDYSSLLTLNHDVDAGKVKRVGVFADDMPQTIVTRVYNYSLNLVQLDGDESPTMIRNLRATLQPDIQPNIQVIKTIRVSCEDDLAQCAQYEGVADYLLFVTPDDTMPSLAVLQKYNGTTPFLIGGIAPSDAPAIRSFSHPRFFGLSLDSHFESSPAVKDLAAIQQFLGDD